MANAAIVTCFKIGRKGKLSVQYLLAIKYYFHSSLIFIQGGGSYQEPASYE